MDAALVTHGSVAEVARPPGIGAANCSHRTPRLELTSRPIGAGPLREGRGLGSRDCRSCGTGLRSTSRPIDVTFDTISMISSNWPDGSVPTPRCGSCARADPALSSELGHGRRSAEVRRTLESDGAGLPTVAVGRDGDHAVVGDTGGIVGGCGGLWLEEAQAKWRSCRSPGRVRRSAHSRTTMPPLSSNSARARSSASASPSRRSASMCVDQKRGSRGGRGGGRLGGGWGGASWRGQRLGRRPLRGLVGVSDGEGGAGDRSRDPQRPGQEAHERGLAGAVDRRRGRSRRPGAASQRPILPGVAWPPSHEAPRRTRSRSAHRLSQAL